MAIKYLDAKRLQGTNAERLAMSVIPENPITTDGSDTIIQFNENRHFHIHTSRNIRC